jgi:hypothetical protein
MDNLKWGLQPDRKHLVAWGARAIWSPGCGVSILHDRQDVQPPDEHDHASTLIAWLNSFGLGALNRRLAECRVQPDEDDTIVVSDVHFRLVANPKKSHGYLYLCGMLLAEGEP